MARIVQGGNLEYEGNLMAMAGQREEIISLEDDDDENDEEHSELKSDREERKQEWGHQFDIWLIRAAKRKRMVEIVLVYSVAGVTKEGNVLAGVPKRVDKYFIQFDVDGQEVWINKQFFVSCKGLSARKEQSDSPAE